MIAATLYIGGAIGLELIGGRYSELHGEDLAYSMMTAVEESLELAGIIIFIRALLVYIADNYKEVQIQVDAIPQEANQLHENKKEGQQK